MEKRFFYCEVCGNMVEILDFGGGKLVCCGQKMVRLEIGTKEASKEKHIPSVTVEDGKINVAVGSVLHPMTEEHYIEWIELVWENKSKRIFLKPGENPVVSFKHQSPAVIYAYCNLHGIWGVEV
ncbi:MAG TPA: desulfoferrodoxin family protein [Bacilli bacterium]|nr:desulfoferrodoxin family protein [Bacilli bacterium]